MSFEVIDLTIPMAPVAKARARTLKCGRSYTPAKTSKAEDTIREYLSDEIEAIPFPASTPLSLAVVFYLRRPKSTPKRVKFPVTRPDIDNYIKLFLDSANGYLWHDDNQLVHIVALKKYGEPSIVISLREYQEV